MRLALVYLDKGGGVGHCALQLTKVLSSLTDTNCYVTTSNTLLEEFRSVKPDLRVFDMKRGWKALGTAMIRRRLAVDVAPAIISDRPDLVLDLGSMLWTQVLQRELRGHYPFAEVVHDPVIHPGVMYPVYAAQRILYPSLADILVSMSDFGYASLRKSHPGKTYISSRHGVILGSEAIDPSRVAKQRKRQLFFGQIKPYKGLDTLIDAYAIAKAADPELELTVAGRGSIKPDLRKRIVDLGVILLNDYIPDRQVTELMSTHGVLLLPYSSATQSGVAAAALANGLPAVATDVGALPEQVVDGCNGIVVPPHNPGSFAQAMLSISADEARAESMSKAALRAAREQYSWELIGERLLADLDSALRSITGP